MITTPGTEEWRHKMADGQAPVQAEFDTLARNGRHIRSFQLLLIPGLLQIPDYIRYRALESSRLFGTSIDQLDYVVAARSRRGEILYDKTKTFDFVFADAALRYLLSPADVMIAQCNKLLSVIDMPNVRLGIIPPGQELSLMPLVGFLMVDDVLTTETYTSSITGTPEEAATHVKIMDALMGQSVTGDNARDLIASATEYLRSL